MREKCVLCHRIHDGNNWKYGSYQTSEGLRYGWFCNRWFKPKAYEFVPQRIREERKKYAKDIVQPFRNGELAKEFVENYPQATRNMVKAGTITQKEVAKAKNVWKGDI